MAKKSSAGVYVKAHMRNGKMVKAYTRGGGSSTIKSNKPTRKSVPSEKIARITKNVGKRTALTQGSKEYKKALKKDGALVSTGIRGQYRRMGKEELGVHKDITKKLKSSSYNPRGYTPRSSSPRKNNPPPPPNSGGMRRRIR